MLRIYRTYNSTMAKYEFYNKLLGSVILLRAFKSDSTKI